MRALDADCILVVEAPNHKTGRSTVDMLERFAGEFDLRAAQAALGFTNDTQQELELKTPLTAVLEAIVWMVARSMTSLWAVRITTLSLAKLAKI